MITCIAVAASLALVAAQDGPAPSVTGAGAPKASAPTPSKPGSIPRIRLQRIAPEMTFRRPVQVVFEPGDDRRCVSFGRERQ